MQHKIIIILLCLPILAIGQQRLKLTGGNLKMGSTKMVLKDTKFTNNGNFDPGDGQVTVRGSASAANSCIGGSSFTDFYNLVIDKSSNFALLGGEVEIENQLTLTNGCLDVGNQTLSFEPGASVTGANASRFIKVSGSGSFAIQVGNSPVTFPVGSTSYNPVTLQNSGTVDNFSVGLNNQVLSNGTSGSPVTSGVVNRTWLIAEGTPGGSNLSITVQWNAGDELGGFNRVASYVSHFTGGAWDQPAAGPASGSGPYTLTRTGVTSFSPFAVASGAILPVELIDFRAQPVGSKVLLTWQTVTESNNRGFGIERSVDGIAWREIGFVEGNGTTFELQSYSHTDVQPERGINYYRLRQMDYDGQFEFSNIESASIDEQVEKKLLAFPNPIQRGKLTVHFPLEFDDFATLTLHSPTGQVLHQKEVTGLSEILNMSIYPAGIYLLTLTNGREVWQERVVRQ